MTREELNELIEEADDLKEQNAEYEVLLSRNKQRLKEIEQLIRESDIDGEE